MTACPSLCGSQSRSSPSWSSLQSWCTASSDTAAARSSSTRPPAQTLPHRSIGQADTPPLPPSRSHNRQHLRRPRRPPRRHRNASTPAVCPRSATTPPSRVMRPSGPSPTWRCPNRPPRPQRPRFNRKRLRPPISAPSHRRKVASSAYAGVCPNRRMRSAAACSACSAAATSTRTRGKPSRTRSWSPTSAR